MNKKAFSMVELVFVLFFFLVFVVGGIGWIKNTIDLLRCDFKAPYKAEIIRGIGCVTPICIVTGYMKIDDK